jgi:Yip1 domain
VNNLGVLVALASEPRKAFDALELKPRVLFPLAVVILAAVGLSVWYISIVDIKWLIEETLRSNPRTANMSEAQLAPAMQFMSRRTFLFSTIAGGILFPVAMRLLEAAYYLLAGKTVNVQRTFKQWLSLACWSSLPQVIAVLPGFLTLAMTSNSQISQVDLSPLSLNALFFQRAMGAPGYALFSAINLLHIASLLLVVIGVHHWSRRSWTFSAIFALLPPALIFGTWALVALGRS